jgi:hypothetical protein
MTDSRRESLEKLRQLGYDVIADEIAKGLQEWDDWLGSHVSIAEDYTNGRLELHAHLAVGIAGNAGPTEYYCINFHFGEINVNVLPLNVGRVTDVELTDFPSRIVRREGSANCKRAVLVDPIQIVDLPEWMRRICVPSVVRLQRLNNGLGRGCDASDFLRRVLSVIPCGSENGELGVADLLVSHNGSESFCQGEGQVVERGPQIKQTVADENAQPQWRGVYPVDTHSPSLVSIEDGLRRWFRVWLVNSFVGFSIDPSSGLCIQGLEMLTCPIKL